tara:strand:+ start:170 stop:1075 length:906 start_codon:yes stop_codon:yes gene_type:complete
MKNKIFKFFLTIFIISFSVSSCGDSTASTDKFAQNSINQKPAVTNTQNNLIIISTDLNLGGNRFVFAITDINQQPISIPSIEIMLTNPNETTTVYDATFTPWPSGKTGVYVSHPYFDKPGIWDMKTTISAHPNTLNTQFKVTPEGKTPKIGDVVPKSNNKTRFSHPNLNEITSDIEPNVDLYNFTVKESIENSKPLLITFSTPGFCQTATCGPQVKIISDLNAKYKDKVNFIHVEIYDNPHELALHFSKRRIAATVTEWGVFTEPFTFIINEKGVVSAKYEGFVTYDEIESDLTKIIKSAL